MRLRRRPRPHECEWRARVAAAVAELDRKGHEGQQYVLIGRMVGLLDPRNELARQVPPPPDPRADPLLGTMPVDAASYRDQPRPG